MIKTKLKYDILGVKVNDILQTFNNLKLMIINLICQFTDKILIIIKMNSSSMNKNNILNFIILITLVTTFFIRLDLIIPIIKYYLSCEMELGLRLLSALYSVLSVFISRHFV